MERHIYYGDIVTDLSTGRVGTFIEFCAPCGAEVGMELEFALVEFGGELGVPNTGGRYEDVRI